MFISLSKTIGKVGGFRIGIGKRITSKNAWWMFLVLFFVYMFQLMWYMCVFSFWLMYAMFYGMWWCGKKIVLEIANAVSKSKDRDTSACDVTQFSEVISDNKTNSGVDYSNSLKFCSNCGAEILNNNMFCIKCGKEV